MTKGILGRKVGMTQIFTKNGILVPVTVIEATPNVVLQVKTNESDGYEAVQVGYQDMREVLSNKPAKGHAAKAKTSPKRFIREIRDVELKDYEVGSEITVDSFSEGDVVDVTGTTRGHGTQGNIKRWGQSRGPKPTVQDTTESQVQWVQSLTVYLRVKSYLVTWVARKLPYKT